MTPPAQAPTYGNWRKPSSPGVGNLGLAGTVALFAGLILAVILMTFWLVAGLVELLLLGLVLAPLAIRDQHGRTLMQRGIARLAWWRGVQEGSHLYRSGPLGTTAHGTCRLPGVAAASRMIEAHDSYGRAFGMIEIPRTGHYTAVMACGADGASLVDQDQIDVWVAYFGAWLANLANEPGLVAAQVTVETAPDTGTRLRAEVDGQRSPSAPEFAQRVMEQIVAIYPSGSAEVTVTVAVTYAAALRPGTRRRSAEEMTREIGSRLPGLTSALAMTGAGEARPMTAREITELVRVAYDPEVAPVIAQAQQHGGSDIRWDDAGPSAAQEGWSDYRHDSAASITWGMSEAPRGEVHSGVLARLLGPHPDIARKRISLLYRPHTPAEAARIVERDRKDARFRMGGSKPAARDSVAVRAAEQAAAEEARGAGVLRFALLATATVTSPEQLPAAAAAMDVLAAPARIQLRRMYGSQALAFSANLPLGLVLPEHAMVPRALREAL